MWSAVSDRTVMDLVARTCSIDPTGAAILFEDGVVLTRGGFLERTEQFAGYLANHVKSGDRVAIMLGNRAEYMIAWVAVLANRGILVSINPQAREHDAAHVLKDSQPVLAIAGEDQRPVIEAVREEIADVPEVVWVGEGEPDGLAAYANGVTPLRLVESAGRRMDITNVYYTSGTTGLPKGCMIDHEYWVRLVDIDLRMHPKTSEDRILCCLQFYYLDPAFLFLLALETGGPMVTMRRFSVSRFWDVVRRYEVTEILGIASIPALLLKVPPSPEDRQHKVKRALQVAVSPNLQREMQERWGFPWIENYGITEGGMVARMPLAYVEEMTGSGSMGVADPEVHIRIVNDEHEDLPPGEVGEVLVSAPGMFRGYLNNPDATIETLTAGWLHTGDLARRDERGFLYFMGRKKDIIRRSGENLSAAEVEEVLRSHPKILEAAVIPVPDELRGEEVKAYILPVEGESLDTLPPEEIVEWCAGKLARYKIPRYIEYRDREFPRTPSMRVKKEDLKAEKPDLTADSWDREKAMAAT
jgi:acyl-CoA synthetase (AMP-forming)/AMP-acid ligase II